MTENRNPSAPNSTDSTDDSSASPPRLKGAQRRIADAYFGTDSGLFVLNCVPGAGKSFVRDDLAAKELLRRWVDGDPTPEQRLCVITFNRNEAASIKAGIIHRLRTLVTHNLTEAAETVAEEDVEGLIQRIRRAPYIGTIDSVLRLLLADIAGDIGFAEVPTVGSDALLQRIHSDCYERLESDPEYIPALERLQEAYPQREYDAGVDELLRQALQYCRSHQLSVTAFETRLTDSLEAVYAEGEPASLADIAAAIARCVSVSEEEALSAVSQVDEQDQHALVEGDRDLYRSWKKRIEEFCTLLDAYQTEYDNRIRDRGVISHLDCAYLVAEYFGDTRAGTVMSEGVVEENPQRRRVRDRHRTRIESWIIDEAQDLSKIQHAALSPFVTPQNRVAVAGDIRQSIYGWRDAHPELFDSAITDGIYFCIDWEKHVVETATRTYRCRPDVAAAINAIAQPALTDPTRGNIGSLDIDYPTLEPVRAPTEEPSVHIASFGGGAQPGTKSYVSPESGKGEAEILATYVACGLADGTLAAPESESKSTTQGETDDGSERQQSDDGDDKTEPAVTVLFRRRRYMDIYAEAFEAQGLSVVNASEPLFACPSVQAVIEVVDWLRDPVDVERTKSLIRDSVLGLAELEELFASHDWDLDTVLNTDRKSLTDQQVAILTGLRKIRDSRGIQHAYRAPELGEEIITNLELRADSFDIAATVSPAQRVANLDAFTEWLHTVDIEDTITPDRVIELVEPFWENPRSGPTQTVAPTTTGDVEFRTIHQMKGDEASIVALADLGFDIWFPGPPNQRFISAGTVAALAPPETGTVPRLNRLSVFAGGLYSPATDSHSTQNGNSHAKRGVGRDVGLRWATERWHDHNTGSSPELVGHNHLQTVARNTRAESWRLLYVALTRAKDHLVLPLPRRRYEESLTDRWVDTIQAGLDFDGSPLSGTYDIVSPVDENGSPQSVSISVNDVTLKPGTAKRRASDSDAADADKLPFAGTVASTESDLQPYIPRILRPSTLAPLCSDPDEWVLKHLQNEPLDTAADTVETDLPISSESIPPEKVGKLVHDILTSVIEYAVSERSGEPTEYELRGIAQSLIDNQCPELSSSVGQEVITFLQEWVFPQFLNSDCWHRIMTAEKVYTEKTLSGLIRINDVEFEFDGESDVVLQTDGDWEVIDLKIALGEVLTETKHRYQLQIKSYAFLLRQEVAGEVNSSLEVCGAERTTILADELPDDLLDYLEMLQQNCVST